MRRNATSLIAITLIFWTFAGTYAGDVRGLVKMPSTCSPEISPAVIWLEPETPADTKVASQAKPAELSLVRQAALQFTPRVVVLRKGQQVRFTNEDSEFHNVHVQARGELFNQTMPPGQPALFTPATTGVLNVLCDIHHHMRAFLIVQDTPWMAACNSKGKFLITDVPPGRYNMSFWHETGGKPIVKSIEVPATGLDLEPITLVDSVSPSRSSVLVSSKVMTWPEVVDQVAMRLSASISSAARVDSAKRARTLAEDAYWVDFEGSDMETAVRAHLGLDRAIELEKRFLKFMSEIRDATKSEARNTAAASTTMRGLVATLYKASEDLKSKNITDRTKVLNSVDSQTQLKAEAGAEVNPNQLIDAIRADFVKLSELANSGQSEEASSYITNIYFGSFEPVELKLVASNPLQVSRIESRFNELRGKLRDGLQGQELKTDVDDLTADIDQLIGQSRNSSAGSFAGGFGASLITILREGIEVILLLTILSGLVTKVGLPAARRAFYAGVGGAVVASLLTAVAINSLVASSRAQTREVLEGVVMLAASAVLFYVSYWLIAQSQTKKWIDFLKSATKKGIEGGGFATIGLTAFLAIYREGAETALMYQALLTNQTATGVYGILSGLCTGLVLLSILAVLIRFASLKLPLQAFFKYTGMMLFGLAVIFAGKGVFELQAAAVLKTTSLAFPWPTVPDLGLYPNLQVFLIQAIMVVGAIASVFVIKSEGRTPVKGAKLAGVKPEAVSAPSAEDFDQPVESESLEPVAASRD